MHNFNYHRPESVANAAALIANSEAKLLAGGMSLLPSLKLRLARYSDIVDLKSIQGLRGITRDGSTLRIGAATQHAVVAASDIVRRAIPALAVLAGGIGDPLVRNRGTVGGSIANADPAADYPSSVLGLGATVITQQREIPGDDFFTGLFETALAPGEIITAVRFPIPERAGYVKLPHPASRFAMVGVFVAKTDRGRSCRRHRRRLVGVPLSRGRAATRRRFLAGGGKRGRGRRHGAEFGYPRQCRISRACHRCLTRRAVEAAIAA